MRTTRILHRALLGATALLVVVAVLATTAGSAFAADDTTTINGEGSTYVGIAMQQWVSDAQTQGIPVNYTATSSPQGLQAYSADTVDFAGSEAEFSSLGESDNVARGYQYTPDVAGATAIMYHVETSSGQIVTSLHLSPEVISKIFTGVITNWDAPAITADNLGLQLPNEPIRVVARSGQSGTTALFYDFISQTDPTDYANFLRVNCFSTPNGSRLLEVDNSCASSGQEYVPDVDALSGSDQEAEFVGSPAGLWSIGYDEFGYPKEYGVPVAWVENASGAWVQPYATNIAAALQSAQLNADLSQNLDNVYTSTNPLTYPISAYSYIVTQCATTSSWPTCAGQYADAGTAQTLTDFMSYIACGGQVDMAELGYSPLPTSLSQTMMDAVARMNGTAPVTLTPATCDNPTFSGGLGEGATNPDTDPYLGCASDALAPGGAGCSGESAPTASTGSSGTSTTKTGTAATTGAGSSSTTKSDTSTKSTGSGSSSSTTSDKGITPAPPPAGVTTATLGTPISVVVKADAPITLALDATGATTSSAEVTAASGALPAGTTVTIYPVASSASLTADVPSGKTYVTGFAVTWRTAAGTYPVASTPVRLTIRDAAIASGSSIYELTSDGASADGTAPSAGTASVAFTDDPLFFVAAPAAATASAPGTAASGASTGSSTSTGSVSTGSGGSTTGSSNATDSAWRSADPVVYRGGVPSSVPPLLFVLLFIGLIAPPLGVSLYRRKRRRVLDNAPEVSAGDIVLAPAEGSLS